MKNKFYLLNPKYWIMNNPLCKEWDADLLELMEKYKFELSSRFRARLGSQIIWIANHPYASFSPAFGFKDMKIRPKRSTIIKAREKLIRDCPEVLLSEYELIKRENS